MTMSPSNAPLAYSYIRFSSVQQSGGDSVRRQTTAARDWCSRSGVRLDESLTFRDLGRSAYLGEHRKNPDRCALAAFLKLVKDDRVPRGSYLIIESLDRLTREHVRAGLMLLLGLIEAGVRIVQLSPSELVYDERSDEMGLMLAIVELSRGHRESKRKSDLIKSVWNKRRQQARDGQVSYTGMLPAWVEEHGGKLRLIPERAAVVKKIFRLATDGYGLTAITRKLVEGKMAPFGEAVLREGRQRAQFCGKWSRAYLANILRDRRAVGEYQPRRREGWRKIPDGPPVPNYFPAVVTEEEWLAVRAGAAQRRSHPGRVGKNVSVFAGLLRHARDGDRYFVITRRNRNRKYAEPRILVNMRSTEGNAPCYSFPFGVFESAILSKLAEVSPRDVLEGGERPDETLTLAGQLAGVEAELADASAFMEANGFSPTIGKRVAALEAQKRDLGERLAEARQKAAHPLSESWGAAQSLLGALEKSSDPEDARIRLRSALRAIVEEIRLLVVPRGRRRLCAAQIRFVGSDKTRDYLILHEPRYANRSFRRDGSWWVRSAVWPGGAPLDLRDPKDAAKLARELGRLDLGKAGG
jgi:DNA invertase Pin-like site-specific DNA recombinase